MAASGRRKGERREPLFDATPTPGMQLRLNAEDRVGGAPERKASKGAASESDIEAPRAARSRSPKAANDDSRGSARATKSGRGKASRGGSGGGRGPLKRLFYWAAVLMLWVGLAGGGMLIWVFAHLPPIQSLEVPPRPPSVQIVGIDGSTLATRGEMGGAAVPLKELPGYLPKAFIAIEDRRFYSHFGLDPIGVARAMVSNVTRGRMREGASTLTQQLAKNLFLTQERTLKRKAQEFVLALWLERKFTKDQLLDLYLNRVYFGSGAYGVEAASQRYFGKSARQVTVAEAAMLAGLVQSPSRLAPTRNPEGAAKRALLVVAAMQDAGFIDEKMSKTVQANPAKVAKAVVGSGSAGYVADWVMDVLDDLIGRFEQDIVVETTIDPVMQAAAEKALADELNAKGAKLDVEQGAVVAITPQGAVRALVGGKNYAESQFNRAVAARRQPGSSFKTFVYLTALEKAGLTPDSIREDSPVNIKGWQPKNYTRQYAGPVTLQRALATSLNTVAVRLTMEVGPKAVAQTAHRLGISSKIEPNASIALGTSEVSVLEMTSAFVPFANGGIMMTPHVVTRIKGANAKILYRRDQASLGRIIEARYVGMMNQMMAETVTSGTAKKADLPGWQAAGKTGTSQDFRDAWFIGYTGNLVTGVWLGNDDSSPTEKASGGGLAVDIWSRFMKVAHQNAQPVELPGVGMRFAPQPPMAGYPQQPYQGTPLPPPGAPAAVPAAYPSGGHPSAVQPRYPMQQPQQAQPSRPVPPGAIPSGGGPRPPGGIPGVTGSVPQQGAQYRPPANSGASEERSFIDKLFGSR
ncbi:penicillin-binding protein 2D [Variibacter gotjawalensis]|uniref:Penicillin-binding protein 2D n=1 Tax=Variibacter gotjawalensis TaxID=1333996 RepID=A0A0S3PP59_9BRAD|nr:PBP1A family penicillin-binding protein [Variibacter gotjawalensis]NIK48015.1 penicillin-binding protein 1A [Variibacter gotjawalensis]RZS49892.1 penicillin-binding protein 1A [Variibacter gotjawalensis]BAT57720.1 penicillin-binding protein 2D [Variibacter gotjawalensis]